MDLSTLPSLTLADGRTVLLVDTGCDLSPHIHLVWLGQISPTFVAVLGDNEGEAHEYAADAIEFPGLDMADVIQLAKECEADGDTEDLAWEHATEGMLALNGGAEWIDADDWGFWSTRSPADLALIWSTLLQMRADA